MTPERLSSLIARRQKNLDNYRKKRLDVFLFLFFKDNELF